MSRRPPDRLAEIAEVIRALGDGEVVSYGDIAATAGYPRQARLVGHLLASTDQDLPWWRVVAADGRLVPGNEREHARLLRAEGVQISRGRVRRSPAGRFRAAPVTPATPAP